MIHSSFNKFLKSKEIIKEDTKRLYMFFKNKEIPGMFDLTDYTLFPSLQSEMQKYKDMRLQKME